MTSHAGLEAVNCHTSLNSKLIWDLISLVSLINSIISFGRVRSDDQGVVQEYCQWESFNASCSTAGQLIVMTSARYGRMKVGRCLPIDYYVGCSADVIEQVDARCSGRKSCSISIPDSQLFKLQPCRKDLVAYFEASFICVSVAGFNEDIDRDKLEAGIGGVARRRGGAESCDVIKGRNLTLPSGYISSHMMNRQPISTSDLAPFDNSASRTCVWFVISPIGQKINVTLLNISYQSNPDNLIASSGDEARDMTSTEQCQVMAIFREENGTDQILRSCSSKPRSRRRQVYLSRGNTLTIILNGTSGQGRKLFLLHYQAIGCSDMVAPNNAQVSRHGDTTLVRCNFTSEKWHMVCRGSVWIGAAINCSSAQSVTSLIPPKDEAHHVTHVQQFPIGLLMAISLGAVVGILVGCLFLLTAFSFRKSLK